MTAAAMSAGRVILVGAGPGDPGLMTARALEVIAAGRRHPVRQADPADRAGRRARRRRADRRRQGRRRRAGTPGGDAPRCCSLHAQEGKLVVRVKGGDPFVFGRGGEEAQAAAASTASPSRSSRASPPASPAPPTRASRSPSAGWPPRSRSSPATRTRPSPRRRSTGPRWPRSRARWCSTWACARCRGSPSSSSPAAARRHEPVAIVERGTLPDQRARARHAGHDRRSSPPPREVKPPSVTIVGPVAALGEELAWLGRGPLEGVSVVVTRPRAQASGLARSLRDLGARVVEAGDDRPAAAGLRGPGQLNDYRPARLLLAQRRGAVLRRAAGLRPRRPRAVRRRGRGDRPGHRGRAARATASSRT